MYTEVNINCVVAVKLTPLGRELHRENWRNEQDRLAAAGILGDDYKPPVEDADGWSEWKMWCLMKEFGKYIDNGKRVPFEPKIRISVCEGLSWGGRP